MTLPQRVAGTKEPDRLSQVGDDDRHQVDACRRIAVVLQRFHSLQPPPA